MGCHVRILRIHGAFAPVECQLTLLIAFRVLAILTCQHNGVRH